MPRTKGSQNTGRIPTISSKDLLNDVSERKEWNNSENQYVQGLKLEYPNFKSRKEDQEVIVIDDKVVIEHRNQLNNGKRKGDENQQQQLKERNVVKKKRVENESEHIDVKLKNLKEIVKEMKKDLMLNSTNHIIKSNSIDFNDKAPIVNSNTTTVIYKNNPKPSKIFEISRTDHGINYNIVMDFKLNQVSIVFPMIYHRDKENGISVLKPMIRIKSHTFKDSCTLCLNVGILKIGVEKAYSHKPQDITFYRIYKNSELQIPLPSDYTYDNNHIFTNFVSINSHSIDEPNFIIIDIPIVGAFQKYKNPFLDL